MRIGTFDIEADGLLDDVSRVHCGCIKDHESGEIHSYIGKDILPALSSYDVLIGHNCIAYDFPVLRKVFGYEYEGEVRDTLLISRTQRPNRRAPSKSMSGPHSVESWAIVLGGKEKLHHEEWRTYSEEMLERCRRDVEIQYRIYESLLREGAGEGWEKAHKLNAKLFTYLQKQEETGWTIDVEHLDRCLYMLNRWIDRIDKAVDPYLTRKVENHGLIDNPYRASGGLLCRVSNWVGNIINDDLVGGPFSKVTINKIDLDKIKQTKEFLLSIGWIPDEWNTDSTGKKTSPKLTHTDSFRFSQGDRKSLGKLIARRIQCKQRRGTLEGLKIRIRSDRKLQSKVSGFASTGRIRHSVIVNIPGVDAFFGKWFRKIFIARPGWKMIGCDSAGNQVRQLAARMGDEEFTNAILHGTKEDATDLHSLNQKRTGLPTRTKAKNFFFGTIFGAQDKKVSQILECSLREAKAFREALFRSTPKLTYLIERLTREWKFTAKKWYNKKWHRMEYRDGWIKGLDGRPILIDTEHKILVYMLQSDEAIHMSGAYCFFNKWMEQRGYKWDKDYACLIWYHDEFQVECKPEIVDEVAELMALSIKKAGEYYKIQCPHEGESKIGNNWYETH